MAGKTGTTEMKQKKGVTGQENGWFVAFTSTSRTCSLP
ncbi:hypothetical protein P9G84_31150 [Brevibacillus centrosporus]|nr:hypothetical protein [Brevibacillus centrosporus]MEC2133315.1 hypothetical protein [Brevibacillus centrosporus]